MKMNQSSHDLHTFSFLRLKREGNNQPIHYSSQMLFYSGPSPFIHMFNKESTKRIENKNLPRNMPRSYCKISKRRKKENSALYSFSVISKHVSNVFILKTKAFLFLLNLVLPGLYCFIRADAKAWRYSCPYEYNLLYFKNEC